MQWLMPKMIRHEAIIEAVMRVSPVLPARLAALFPSLEALERFFAIHHAAIESFLAEVENKDEWVVRGVMDRARLRQWLAAHVTGGRQASGPAAVEAGCLRQRHALASAGREVNQWMTQTLEPILNELRRCAVGSCQRCSGAQTGGQPQLIFNQAFLVARENLPGFRRCVESATLAHRAPGLKLQMSGPWPPYSFCPTLHRSDASDGG
jgi:hypothetical protein